MIKMNACEITAAVTAAANTIACRLNDEELALWSSVLVQLGDTLATIAAQRDLCSRINFPTNEANQ
jgi:hypothetical protein